MNKPIAFAPLPAALGDFVLGLSDALLVVGAAGDVVLANAAARKLLGTAREPASLDSALGAAAAQRVRALLSHAAGAGFGRGAEALPITLAGGRTLKAALQPLDSGHWALRLQPLSRPARSMAAPGPAGSDAPAGRELIGMFWDSPFPASLQDSEFRLTAVNDAYVQFAGYPREHLLGMDPASLQPEEDRAATLAARRPAPQDEGAEQALVDQRLVDGSGRQRWFRAVSHRLPDAHGRGVHLTVLQDTSAEHAAREQADRSELDLNAWFDISALGMVLYDDSGLLVRSNRAFEALVGSMPVTLAEAPPGVQHLLGWEHAAPSAELAAGRPALTREAWTLRADGSQRRLRALVRGYRTPAGHRRYMAAVEDRSTEDERDLARMQIGALMDTAGVGVATFQESAWLQLDASTPSPAPPDSAAARAGSALQSVGRDMVVAASLPDYEQLQQALRRGERFEARYAIEHPELGRRWLLTRVEPGQLASGKRTTSVVTLDVTHQQQAQARNEQLLRELGTILESSPAGIVYVRGEVVLRCNRRFERMVGLPLRSAAGRSARELFAGVPVAQGLVADMLEAVEHRRLYETEFRMPRPDGVVQWVALSARSFRSAGGSLDVVAVLSDITRLKLQQAELESLARDRQLMFSLSEVGIAFLRDGRIQRANGALERLSGHAAEHLVGLEVSALFSDRAQFHQAWALEDAALRQSGRWSGERPMRRSDGSLLWVQVSKRLVIEGDPGGGIIASYVNVDDRRRAEASLSEQAQTTRAVLDSVLVGIVTVGPDGIEWMNRSARRMFGGALADFVGQPIGTVATPEPDHPLRRGLDLHTLEEGQAETFECRLRARDGREFWVAGNAVMTRNLAGGRQLTYALLDIERRREAELRTAQAQASLQRIIDMGPLAITLHDARTLKVLQINQTALAHTRRSAGEVVGHTPQEIYPPQQAARMRADMQAALDSAEPQRHEYRVEDRGGAQLWDARYLALSAPGQQPDQLLLVATEVTEQRAAEQARLEAAIAQRDMLVKEVHHRIKNNLQGVAGLLQQTGQRRPEVAAVMAEVVGQVQAIAQVYGLQVGTRGPLQVKSLVEAVVASVQRGFGRDIAFVVEDSQAADAAPWVLPEPEAIPIALTLNELLTNAVKHGAEGRLDCVLSLEAARVCIAISNAGLLPDGFDVARVPGGVSGLGLVRALLPRRHATLALHAHAGRVVAEVQLVVPGVIRLAAADPA